MPVTRTDTRTYLAVTPDDHGNVQVAADGQILTITPDEGWRIAAELIEAARVAYRYRAEMADEKPNHTNSTEGER